MNKSDKYRTAVIRMAKGIHRDIRMDDTDCPWLRVVLPSRYGNCAVLFEFNTWQIEGLLLHPVHVPSYCMVRVKARFDELNGHIVSNMAYGTGNVDNNLIFSGTHNLTGRDPADDAEWKGFCRMLLNIAPQQLDETADTCIH